MISIYSCYIFAFHLQKHDENFAFFYLIFQKHHPTLSYDELTTVRKNLQRDGVDVDTDYIRLTWYPIYRRHFLKQALQRAYDCRKAYYLYTQQGTDCVVIKSI